MSGHKHSHDHHRHDLTQTEDGMNRIALATALVFTFMLVEIAGALVSGSLALLADATHMLTDAGALMLSWLGYKLARRPSHDQLSYGWSRFKILAAFVNGLALICLSIWITAEAVHRLSAPQPIHADILLWVALCGLIVNLITFRLLHSGDPHDLNMRAALWHVAGDMLGSVAAILSACIIMLTGWMRIDPILSITVAAIILFGGIRLLGQTGRILIQGVPKGLSPSLIIEDLETQIHGLERVEHLHVWSLNETQHLATLEVYTETGACGQTVRSQVKQRLKEAFGIFHTTVELYGRN